jgi:LPS sulfotransferase NodH
MLGRPDALDLIGPDFDRATLAGPVHTLIICSAPRTGSYELCRYLLAAGIGIPHEYFSPNYSRRIAKRWGLPGEPLSERRLGAYIQALRSRRSAGGVFGVKLMYADFDKSLRNPHGAALFSGATVVHLFRPDVTAQFRSFRKASESGLWDFSERHTRPPRRHGREESPHRTLQELEFLVFADFGFRRLFAILDADPLFVTTDRLFSDPISVVRSIADRTGVPINLAALERMISLGAPYPRGRATSGIDDGLRRALHYGVFGC